MFDLIKKMLPFIDNKCMKENNDLQILAGKYKIPMTFKEGFKQIKRTS